MSLKLLDPRVWCSELRFWARVLWALAAVHRDMKRDPRAGEVFPP